MTARAGLAHINRYWSTFFDCPTETLSVPGTRLLPHAALEGYPGIVLFRREKSLIVSVPAAIQNQLAGRLDRPAAELFDRDTLTSTLGNAIRNLIGPAWLGYVDAASFAPVETLGARLLTDADEGALRVLAGQVSRTEWEHSGIEFGAEPIAGLFIDRKLVAAGRLEPRDERIVDLGLLTAPAARGKGHGRAVAATLTEWALASDLIVQYRTLVENEAAIAIARALGFERYAETISVQLTRVA